MVATIKAHDNFSPFEVIISKLGNFDMHVLVACVTAFTAVLYTNSVNPHSHSHGDQGVMPIFLPLIHPSNGPKDLMVVVVLKLDSPHVMLSLLDLMLVVEIMIK